MRWSEQDLRDYLARRGTVARRAEPPRLHRPARADALSEEAIQRAVFAHLRTRGAPGTFAFHVPNGGWRSRVEASILNGLGVRAGVPDLIIIRDGRTYALELKTSTGRLSPDQLKVRDELRAAGCEVGVTFGLDEALAWLAERGLLRGALA